jgi:hypothetical protein
VFLPAETEEGLIVQGPGQWESRRDYALSPTQQLPQLATSQWPEPDRVSIERFRRVHLDEDENTLLFFLPRYPFYRQYRWRAWNWWY